MKSQLQALQLQDPATIFICRRINKLGFSSADQLRKHFSSYGVVKDIYVSHSRVKSLRPVGSNRRRPDLQWRLRAAALGFVVMASPEVTAGILAAGPEHNVQGVTIRVDVFHRRAWPHDDACDQESSCSKNNAVWDFLMAGGQQRFYTEEELHDAMPEQYED